MRSRGAWEDRVGLGEGLGRKTGRTEASQGEAGPSPTAAPPACILALIFNPE